MALRTSSSARAGSAISPLRTPRERAWPTPMMLRAPAALISPTTAQIFEVPISNPTMMAGESNIFPFWFIRFDKLIEQRRHGVAGHPAHRQVVGDGDVQRGDGFALRLAVVVDRPPAAQLDVEL